MRDVLLRILIVAGAADTRETMADIIAADPTMTIMGAVADPYMAARCIRDEIPDVIILDMETPRMSGLTFLRKIMEQCPLPVVTFSARAERGSGLLSEALEIGAADVILLPGVGGRQHLLAFAASVRSKVKIAARRRGQAANMPSLIVSPKLSADVILPPPIRNAKFKATEKVVCIGASTGGTESLRVVLELMPLDCPGVVVVQHMPETFTGAFARRLDSLCPIAVKEAEHGDAVLPGRALIAPGGHHILLARREGRYVVDLKDGPLVSRHCPSVDVLFRSAARCAGDNSIGVIMTGMGDDGAHGLLEMRRVGASTIAEHESTCVVYGMPKEAIDLDAAEYIVPLPKIAEQIALLSAPSRR